MFIRKPAVVSMLIAGAAALLAAGLALTGPSAPPSGPSVADELKACTVFLIGKGASADGSVMSTHAADCGVCDFTWRHVPAAVHRPGAKRKLYHIDHFVLDRRAARWAFDYVDFHVQVAYNAAIRDVEEARKTWEDAAVLRTMEIDERDLELYKKNPREAVKFLTGYCLNNAKSVVDAWWKLGDDLWVKYNHLNLCNPGTRRSGRIPTADPPWWDRAVRGFDVLAEPDRK